LPCSLPTGSSRENGPKRHYFFQILIENGYLLWEFQAEILFSSDEIVGLRVHSFLARGDIFAAFFIPDATNLSLAVAPADFVSRKVRFLRKSSGLF
jgi:hypothetical protein